MCMCYLQVHVHVGRGCQLLAALQTMWKESHRDAEEKA